MSASAGSDPLRVLRADNASALTLDGTRTYLVGHDPVAIIDPGPDQPRHLDAVADLVGGGVRAFILLTHEHPDHAAGADGLASRLGCEVHSQRRGSLSDGRSVATDAGALRVLSTPGHTQDHVAFHWPDDDAVFVGDLMLGGMDSALVAPPEGDLGEYLASLERVRATGALRGYPAHGAPFDDLPAAVADYLQHREDRLDQVRSALERARAAGAPLTLDDAVDAVYGPELPVEIRPAAAGAARAYLDYLSARGEARAHGGARWS